MWVASEWTCFWSLNSEPKLSPTGKTTGLPKSWDQTLAIGTVITGSQPFHLGFPGGSVVKNLPAMQETQERRHGFDSWVGKSPQRRAWQFIPVLLPRESHGQRSLTGYSPQCHKELGMTEATEHAHTQKEELVSSLKQLKSFFHIPNLIAVLIEGSLKGTLEKKSGPGIV